MPSPKKFPSSEGRKFCRSLIDAVNDVVLIFDPLSLRILDANKRALQVYGYSRQEIRRKHMRDLSPEDRDYSALVRARQSFEGTHITKTGDSISFLVSLSLINFWGRKIVLSLNRDIGERKRIEEAIAANEAKLRMLVQSISEIILLIDDQGRIKFVSPQVERVLELSVRDLLGQNIFSFIHPEDRARAAVEYAQTMQTPGENPPSALRVQNRAGEWIPFEIIANNQLNDPNVGGVIFTARDLRYRREAEATIHESNEDFDKRVEERALELARANTALRLENQQRRQTEAQLKQSLSLLNGTFESTADGILVVSSDRLISGCNRKFLDMWNIPRMAVTGLRDDELLSMASALVQDEPAFCATVEELYANPDAVSFDIIKLKDGRIFHRYTQPQRVGDDIVGRVWSFRDVTAGHRLEEELRQAQKMEAMGRLAGGIAHDFNNLLMLISGYDRQILADPQLPAPHRESGERMMEGIQRAASLTRQLLAFSRKHPVEPQVIDLNLIAAGLEKLLERLLQQSIQLVFKLHPGTLPIYADPWQIELMIMNLVLNARDAMPNGGALTIITREEAKPESAKKGEEPPPALALLEVSDTGHGMEADVKEHIFEPFFTTKEVGKGTGLGLSTVYGIVEQAGGWISVESEPGRGSTFRISLPIASASLQQAARENAAKPKANAASAERPAIAEIIGLPYRETILLVEDEPGIRKMTRAYLETQGYTVLDAANATEAIRIAADYKDQIDLVVSDVIMPGMHGNDLVRALRKDRPEVSAIYITGLTEPQDLGSDVPVIEKPFEFSELGSRIREVLDAARKNRSHARKSA